MNSGIDLNLLPLNRIAGQDKPSLPGFMIIPVPRKTGRGRDGDRLFVYVTLAGNSPIPHDDYASLLEKMGSSFYASAGSLTAALRNAADVLNQALLTRNLGSTGQGQYIVGRLILGVLRGNQLILVQSGPTHAFHVSATNTLHLHDADLSGRGLGFSQAAQLYYSQLELNPGELLVLTPQLPSGWESAMLESRGISTLDSLQRKLQSFSGQNHGAILVQVQVGKGTLSLIKPNIIQAVHPPINEQSKAAEHTTETVVENSQLTNEAETRFSEEQNRHVETLPHFPATGADQPAEKSTFPADIPFQNMPIEPDTDQDKSAIDSHFSSTSFEEDDSIPDKKKTITTAPQTRPSIKGPADFPEIQRSDGSRRKKFMLHLLNAFLAVKSSIQKINQGFQTLFRRALPGEKGPLLQGSSMAFIAIIVPLLVVVIASTVYMRFGRSAQYKEYYNLAVQEAMGTINQADLTIIKHAWESTIYYLDKAEEFQVTNDSSNLRQLAQDGLDTMEKIIRLDFRLAIYGGLSKSMQVEHMVANDTDLYLLTKPQGTVARFFLTSQGYEADVNFQCVPGSYESIDTSSGTQVAVDQIVDMIALPKLNPFGASLMGMDANGALIFCQPNVAPSALKLEDPYTLWKEPNGFALGEDDYALYILDPSGNAVWVYAFDRAAKIFGSPELFFSGNYVAQSLPEAVDIAVNGSDLYLLFADGHVTHCTPGIGDVVPIRCNDPETQTDSRSGYHSGPILAGARITFMTFSTRPDPSLYTLDAESGTIYRFSPRPEALFLQNLFRSAAEQEDRLFPSAISAMAISPGRVIFLCVGNQVYFASDVP